RRRSTSWSRSGPPDSERTWPSSPPSILTSRRSGAGISWRAASRLPVLTPIELRWIASRPCRDRAMTDAAAGLRPMRGRRKAFLIAAVAAGTGFLAYAVWIGFTIGGPAVTLAVDDYGEAVPALLAAAAAFAACRHAQGRGRAAWLLIGASALAWAAGELA